MKIAVNTRLLIKDKLEGIGWFMWESLQHMVKNHPEVTFLFIFDRKPDKIFLFADNIRPVVVPPQARHPFLYFIWFNMSVAWVLKKEKPDLFLSPDGYIPLPVRIPTLTVIHDLNFEHHPEDLPWPERKYYKTFFPKYAQKATRVATVSEFSKNDIARKYQIAKEKIDVVYNGAAEIFQPVSKETKEKTRATYTNNQPYFFFIGALHPRKNITNLLKAYEIFRSTTGLSYKLVLAGNQKWWVDSIKSAYNQHPFKKDIILTGRVSLSQLHHLMASAEALTYVSYFEGFGIPVVEAFRCGTPVITSNITSMPEVAGEAALLVNPYEPDDIARAMRQIAGNNELRNKLIAKGFEQMQSFRWELTAQRLWHAIEKTLNTQS